jgi:UDP-3-O-[3-hydroxymyristoyl] glucosamine N-acyltransferase
MGPFCVVEAAAQIGPGARLGSHVYIGAGVVVGANCQLESGSVLLAETVLGRDCKIAAGAVLGSQGFGFVLHEGRHKFIPQVSKVVLGDGVIVGPGSCIDRGTLEPTVLEDGVELGAQVQLAHNCKIGAGSRIEHQSGLAGSSQVGAQCELGLQTGMAGQASLGDRSKLAVRGGLLRKTPPDSDLWGFPARPKGEAMRAQAALFRLAKGHEES